MVIFLALAMIAAEPDATIRFAKGEVTIENDVVETGEDAYAELAWKSATRLRVSASTRLIMKEHGLELVSGRVWIQSTRDPLLFEMPGVRLDISARSSVVAEHTRLTGDSFTVRAGKAVLVAAGEVTVIDAKHLAIVHDGRVRVQPGGAGLSELALREAQAALGDLLGLSSFLLAQANQVSFGSASLRGTSAILRTDAEVAGGDAGPGGVLVEGALKAPPFFEEEVPPKGPNVRVEVTFGEE
jgi:hypothetical protein